MLLLHTSVKIYYCTPMQYDIHTLYDYDYTIMCDAYVGVNEINACGTIAYGTHLKLDLKQFRVFYEPNKMQFLRKYKKSKICT
jgi:hypothetical protein